MRAYILLALRRDLGPMFDRMQRPHWDAAIRGDPRATDRVLDIMEKRAKVLRLDAEDREP